MKTINKINDKEILKRINAQNYYDVAEFAEDCKRYTKAVKDRRLIVSIVSVSASGMSRTFKVREIRKAHDGGYCLDGFYSFFKAIGESLNKDGNVIMKGCGMDMVFALNHNVCGVLRRLGVLNSTEYNKLSQTEINRM